MKTVLSKNTSTIFLICLAASVFSRCTFTPHEENFSYIKTPEPIDVTFIVNDPRFTDPYYLIQPTHFHFRLEELDNAILSSEIKLNGNLIESSLTDGGVSFILDPNNMVSKDHNIDMVIYADTKSGSLASIVGAEFYIIEQSFKVIIDPTPPEFRSFKANLENGYLTMRWVGPQEKKNFFYKVSRYNSSSWFSSDTTIYNPQANHYIDPGYVGGSLNYNLSATGFGFNVLIGMDDLYVNPVDFELKKDAEGNVRLVWTKSDVSTENVIISVSASPLFVEKSYPFSSSGEILLDKPGFMEGVYINVYLHRIGYSSQKSGITLELQATPNLKQFENFAMLKNREKLLVYTDNEIYRYSLNGFILEDSLVIQDKGLNGILSLVITPDESTVYVGDGTGDFISFDPLHFDIVKQHDITSSTKNIADPNSNFSYLLLGNATDSGLLSVNFWQGSRYAMVFDINSGEVLWHSAPGNHHCPTISNDGKYIAVDLAVPYVDYEGWILKKDNGDYLPIGKIDRGDHIFLPGGEEVMSITRITERTELPEGNYMKVFKLTDPPQNPNMHFGRIREALIPYKPGLFRIGYDPFTNYLWFTYYDFIDLFNPTTMLFEKSFTGQIYLYSNNYILTRSGFIKTAE